MVLKSIKRYFSDIVTENGESVFKLKDLVDKDSEGILKN